VARVQPTGRSALKAALFAQNQTDELEIK
jgi:hypothetical protein